MPGTTHVSSSSTDTTTPPGVRQDVDLDRTVWFGGGEAYHRDSDWGPACPDQIGRCDEHTLADAVDEDLRPCRQCEPVDYRRLATDGGVTVDELQEHSHANELEGALDFVMEAARRARDLDVDDVATSRLQLAECGARLAFYATTEENREVVLDDARRHLETALDAVDDGDVSRPIREALQLYVGYEERRRPDPTPAPRTTSSTSSSTASPSAPFKRTVAGTFSIVTGVGAGLALANADFVRTVETSAGDAIVTSAPGAAFWTAVGLMLVAQLLVAYAATGGRR